jgi:hypothetical protein
MTINSNRAVWHQASSQGYCTVRNCTLSRNRRSGVWDGEENASRIPHKAESAFLWYRTLLKNTPRSDPILYCRGETYCCQSFHWWICQLWIMIGMFDCLKHLIYATTKCIKPNTILQEGRNGPCFTTPTSLPSHHPAVNTNPTSLYEYPNKLSTNK